MQLKRRLPVNFNPLDQNIFNHLLGIELPEPSYSIYKYSLVFKNGILFNFSGVAKQSLLYDIRLKEIGGYFIILKMIIKEVLKGSLKFISNKNGSVATVVNEWSNNYFHWVTEVLPKVYFLKNCNKDFSILLPSNFVAEYQLTSLRQMNVPIIYFDRTVFIKKIYLPSRQSPYSAHYNPTIIRGLSNQLVAKTDVNLNLGRFIYITRRNANIRKIENEKEVISLLCKYDFKIIEFESLSFQQQISVSYNAEIMISIHGAGLTNMIFCKPGTVILEFSLVNQILDKCYYTLADACHLSYYYQFCNSTDMSLDYYSANLIVDIKLLNQNLAQILNKKND